MKPEELPLIGVTILDLTRVLAGPYCTRLLCDLGARVIKIERQGEGDEMRRNYLQLEPGREDQSSYFTRVNAGKESVSVDLGRPEGQVIVHDLARVADVAVENFMPGVVARLRCDYATLRALKPDIIYCSISGFGQTGPWRARPAFAHIINAVSGLMHLEQGDEPAPRTSNLQAADVLAGTHAAVAILGAITRRARTGQGAHLDVSMLEALVAADSVTYAAVLNGGREYGNPRPGMIVAPIGERYLAMQFTGSGELWPRLRHGHAPTQCRHRDRAHAVRRRGRLRVDALRPVHHDHDAERNLRADTGRAGQAGGVRAVSRGGDHARLQRSRCALERRSRTLGEEAGRARLRRDHAR